MFIKDYKKNGISIESLPVHVLEAIDIQDGSEQKLIQSLIDRKRRALPTDKPIYQPGDKTDFKNKEEELAFQKVIDERKARLLPQAESLEPETDIKKFCEFCPAKGPIKHMKDCPQVKEKNLMTKIEELKQDRKIKFA